MGSQSGIRAVGRFRSLVPATKVRQMTLYRKTLAIIVLTFVGLIGALYGVSQYIVLGSFSAQEDQDTLQNVQRVESALNDNLASLAGSTRDWPIWDDPY